jgi:protein-tyrosine kinase
MSTIEKALGKLGRDRGFHGDAGAQVAPSETVQMTVSGDPASGTLINANAPESSSYGSNKSSVLLDLPLISLADKGLVTPFAPRSRVAEEFRAIKRPLLRNIEGGGTPPIENANLIMVTSALQGDGKTFTALNLAMSTAMEQDKTVLFVDADVAKATAGGLLGVPAERPGLIDVLEGKGVTLADVILNTSIENLRILPAGNIHERSTELLAGRNMQQLMLEMSNRYSDRVIIFDSPPLLLTTEASVLASFMGQIAFVVSAGETPRDAVTKALEHIGDDKIIGMILNKTHYRRNGLLGYGYGYGYAYGQGYGHGYGHDGRGRAGTVDGQNG